VRLVHLGLFPPSSLHLRIPSHHPHSKSWRATPTSKHLLLVTPEDSPTLEPHLLEDTMTTRQTMDETEGMHATVTVSLPSEAGALPLATVTDLRPGTEKMVHASELRCT
jgi:hypothetical protein